MIDVYSGKHFSFKVLLFVPLYFYIVLHAEKLTTAVVFAIFVALAWTFIDVISNQEQISFVNVINFSVRLIALLFLAVFLVKYKLQRVKLSLTSEKLKSEIKEKNEYVGMAAHDLRSPIGNIFSFTELLMDADNINLNEKQKRYIENIRKISGKMILLLKDTLDFSKVESGTVKLNKLPYEYITTIYEVIENNRVFATKKGMKILFYSDKQKLMVNIDRNRIEQVVENLLSNAIKYSKPNTEIKIKVSQQTGYVVTEVEDKGVGIKEQELEHVFKPFVKSSSRPTAGEESTGLGLAIVKKLVEAHGGTIYVQSKLNVGTTFTYTLPINM